MEEAKNENPVDSHVSAKRKPESECVEEEDYKKQKAEEQNGEKIEEERNGEGSLKSKNVVDSKGKGIVLKKDDKGKGKLTVEEYDDEDGDDDDDDDDEDGGIYNSEEEDSDLSDDPLAEVDLNNILPSRTRRRVVQPGEYLVNDMDNNNEDSSSDDSDA